MIKEICGVRIFPLIVMLYQVRRWWTLRKLRNWWRDDMHFLKLVRQYRQYKQINNHFSFDRRYRFLRRLTGYEQQRGII
ncbi:hypothetical protein AB204_14925 [Xenorhabdus khoisanae]|uniref:Uncharacterized protein n=1 Tax=Xenorhabdus khoisanae TaxID=880157 RepID=A0A0J5FQY8_9GAMM|nr:hypothetical protein AB204_14925 [Xenorhabdus khoisanae]